jgi:hypothetical protein
MEDLPALQASCACSPAALNLTLDFRCDQLLSGEAGETMLRRLQPSLAGRGAMVNVGEMKLRLPPEAAAVLHLLPYQATMPAIASMWAGQATPGSLDSGAQAALLATSVERLYTGPARSGGRALQDAEDDW